MELWMAGYVHNQLVPLTVHSLNMEVDLQVYLGYMSRDYPTISITLYTSNSYQSLLISIYTKIVHVTRLSQGATCTQALSPSF
jgi:hypothetical protein